MQVGSGSKPCGTAVIFGDEKPPRAENKFGEANAKNCNKNAKLLYKLDKRKSILVLIDLIGFGLLFLMIISSAIAYLTGIFLALGFLVSLLFIVPMFEIILFNYIKIYKDRIIINRFILGDALIKNIDIFSCSVFDRPFILKKITIGKKAKQVRRLKTFTIMSLDSKQVADIEKHINSIIVY